MDRRWIVISLVAACQADSVEPEDASPEVEDGELVIGEDQPGSVQLVGHDDDEPVQFLIVTSPGSGTATLDGARLTYTPHHDFAGTDEVQYVASDGKALSRVATLRVTVTPVNDAPSVDPLSLLQTPSGLKVSSQIVATDIDGDPLSFAIVTPPNHGMVHLDATGSFTYQSVRDEIGPDSIVFSVSDGVAAAEITAMVTLVRASFDGVWTSLSASEHVFSRDLPCNAFSFSIAHTAQRLTVNGFAYQCSDGTASSSGGTTTMQFDIASDGTLTVAGAPVGTMTPSGFSARFPFSLGGQTFPIDVVMSPSLEHVAGYDLVIRGFLSDLKAVVTRP